MHQANLKKKTSRSKVKLYSNSTDQKINCQSEPYGYFCPFSSTDRFTSTICASNRNHENKSIHPHIKIFYMLTLGLQQK